ncbi:MAG TPA: DNA polymerase III subunit delta [Anaerolineales bacterium]|nr:DNA polymerase III subunit delta [Anaerolineales bacterium]
MPNIFFLFGNDEFAISRRLKDFEADFEDPTSANMNTARLEARSMSEDDLGNALNSMPFLAKRRLVLLANPSSKFNNPQARKKFLEFVTKAPETSQLVMYESVEPKEVEKHWLVKWAEKNGSLIQSRAFMLPRLKDMTGWIVNETKNQGGKIDPRAAEMLKDMVGVNTRQAGMEIAKLLAYVNWAREIKIEDVQTASIVTAEADVFAMINAMATGGGKEAQRLFHRILEKDDADSVFGLVLWQFRLILLVREMLDVHKTEREIIEVLTARDSFRYSEYPVRKSFDLAKRFSMETLENIHRSFLVMDEMNKSGQMDLDLSLDRFIAQLSS